MKKLYCLQYYSAFYLSWCDAAYFTNKKEAEKSLKIFILRNKNLECKISLKLLFNSCRQFVDHYEKELVDENLLQ